VISQRTTPVIDSNSRIFWDNDSLAALIGTCQDYQSIVCACYSRNSRSCTLPVSRSAVELSTEALIILSDVQALYASPPSEPHAQKISVYRYSTAISFGQKSRVGRGGMEAKIGAAIKAAEEGVPYVVISSGFEPDTIRRIMAGEDIGTLFNKITMYVTSTPRQGLY